MKVTYLHDRIATPIKIAKLFDVWLKIHSWQRRPRLTNRRIQILNSEIQEKGFNQCLNVLNYLASDNEYSNHLKEKGHTKLRNIFSKHTWDEKVRRSGGNNERI